MINHFRYHRSVIFYTVRSSSACYFVSSTNDHGDRTPVDTNQVSTVTTRLSRPLEKSHGTRRCCECACVSSVRRARLDLPPGNGARVRIARGPTRREKRGDTRTRSPYGRGARANTVGRVRSAAAKTRPAAPGRRGLRGTRHRDGISTA